MLIVLAMMTTLSVNANAFQAEWIDLTGQTPAVAPPRSGHVAFTVDEDIYVFGGYAEEESPDNRYPTNDSWKFCNGKWELVQEPGGTNPQPRLAAAAATLDNIPYIFGGWDSQQTGTGGVILSDVVQFISDGTWKTVGDLGLPTSRLVAVNIGNDEQSILLHNHRCVDHVMLWKNGGKTLSTQPTTGQGPSPRGLHVAAALGTDKVVIFGGAAQDGNMSNEVFVLNLNTWVWKRLEIKGNAPSPRASPCFCALDDTTCVLFGGADRTKEGGLHGCNDLWLLHVESETDDDNCQWENISPKMSPPGRNAATLTPMVKAPPGQDPNCQYFLLAGGWYPFQTTHADTFVLKVSLKNNRL